MEKQKNGELSRMFGYAGKFHALTVLGCVLSGISTILSMLPFVCIWLVIRDLIQAFAAGDISLATESTRYAWIAVVFAAASILIYFIALNCTHLAAFRTATNMRKTAIHHIVTLPLGYFSQNASGRLRKIIDDNAGLTEGFLAHQLPDLTGAAVSSAHFTAAIIQRIQKKPAFIQPIICTGSHMNLRCRISPKEGHGRWFSIQPRTV